MADEPTFYERIAENPEKFANWSGAVEDGEVLVHPKAGDAIYAVYRDFESFIHAPNPLQAAYALVDLHNSMDSLITWIPGYVYETGKVEEIG